MRIIKGCMLAATTLALLSGKAEAQDFFGSTNTTSINYNYIEAQYLVDIDSTPPVLATVLIDVFDNWSITGEYTSQDFGNVAELAGLNPEFAVINAEVTAISVGGLYHRSFPFLKQSDWIAGVLLGRAEVVAEAPAIGAEETTKFNFQEFFAGIRKTLTPKLEGELTLNYFRALDDDDITADVTLVYRLLRSFDVALSGNEIGGDEGNILGVGLRYTW